MKFKLDRASQFRVPYEEIEINTLEELLDLADNKEGCDIIVGTECKDGTRYLTVYDDYME